MPESANFNSDYTDPIWHVLTVNNTLISPCFTVLLDVDILVSITKLDKSFLLHCHHTLVVCSRST